MSDVSEPYVVVLATSLQYSVLVLQLLGNKTSKMNASGYIR